MSDLREIYQQVVLDHYKKPRNYRRMEGCPHSANGHNPLCGDRVTVYVKLANNAIDDISFEGSGCAICTASASLMTESLKGRTEAEAEEMFQRFHHLLTAENVEASDSEKSDLGKLKVFEGVREFPVRIKCATLPWHTFHAALKRKEEPVTTE